MSKYSLDLMDKYIFKEVRGPIFFGVSLFTFVFLLDVLVELMEGFLLNGISFVELVRIISFYLPPIVSQTLPLGFFLGIIVTYTKLTSTSESTAMFSMGMDLKKILKPVIILSLGFALFIIFLQESIIPQSFEKLEYLTKKIAYEKPTFQLQEKIFIDDIENYSIYVDGVDKSDGVAKNIIIYEHREGYIFPTPVTAERTYWEEAAMFLEDAKFYRLDERGYEELKGHFDVQKIPLNSLINEIDIDIDEIEAKSFREVYKNLQKLETELVTINEVEGSNVKNDSMVEEALESADINLDIQLSDDKDESLSVKELESEIIIHKIELNRKLAMPFATILLGVIGVILSISHHRVGRGTNFLFSMALVFSYMTILNIGIVIGNTGRIPAFIAVWTPNMILLVITLHLYRRKQRRG